MTSTAPAHPTVVRRAGARRRLLRRPGLQLGAPRPGDRARTTSDFFAAVVAELAPHDETWTTGDGTTGAALWVPPGRPGVAEDRAEAFGGRMAEIWGPAVDRAGALVGLMEERHPQTPHEYLWFLGVVPARQGRGIGGALLAPVLERADRARTPAYPEATSARNRDL